MALGTDRHANSLAICAYRHAIPRKVMSKANCADVLKRVLRVTRAQHSQRQTLELQLVIAPLICPLVWRGKVDGAPCAVGLPGPRAQGLAACRTAGSERGP